MDKYELKKPWYKGIIKRKMKKENYDLILGEKGNNYIPIII